MPKRKTDDSDELTVTGLIDVSDSEEESQEEKEEESVQEEEEEEEEEDSDSDSFASLLGEEDDVSVDSDFDTDTEVDQKGAVEEPNQDHYSTYSDGSMRVLKPEIVPTYDSDDSDAENFNTIGNIPLSAYEEMPHIGYDINGKRIMRPAKGSALDQLLEQIDLPEGWTGLLDQNTGESLKLSSEELELIRKIQEQESTTDNIDPYEPYIDWFTRKTEAMPLTAQPEPKRRFVPSKHEAKRVMKLVRAIREGKILTPDQVRARREEEENNFDLWQDEGHVAEHVMTLRAPKLPPPGHDESYNPPPEYLLTEEERKEWEETERGDRERNFVPAKYSALRKVPGYQEGVRERFERCLDLYLAPRVRHNKLNVDPESLIPELPSPQDLRPFPIRTSTRYIGHEGKIRCITIHPSGLWLATGGDDGTVRVWEVLTGREVHRIALVRSDNTDDHVESLAWCPDASIGLLLATAGEFAYLIVPPIFGFDVENVSKLRVEAGWGYGKFENTEEKRVAEWYTPKTAQTVAGVCAVVQTKKTIKKASWHRKGDYFVTVSPDGGSTAVLVHQLSKHSSQSPFKKSKGIVMDAQFHPSKPQLFVASQRTVRIYDLAQQKLVKKLLPGARMLASIDVHPRGDNMLACSYDKRVLWHDLDLASTPYKNLRYHEKAVRSVRFHKSLPLFASGSDDGSIHVFHATVYDDYMTNPLLVPLKKLTHGVRDALGVLDVVWHPKEAWLFSGGGDGEVRLWTT